MGYCLQKGEPLKQGLHRTLAEQHESILQQLANDRQDPADTIHEVRKACKRVRALLRLLRDDLDQLYRSEDLKYRDAAQLIAQNRDTEAMLETYHNLTSLFGDKIKREISAPIYRLLAARKAALSHCNETSNLRKFSQIISTSYRDINALPINYNSDDSIVNGLSQVYSKACQAMKATHNHPNSEAYHNRRKWVKYHGYHLRLLRKVFPTSNKKKRALTNELGELLGDHHNLYLLHSLLKKESTFNSEAKARKKMLRFIELRIEQIEVASISLGNQLFNQKPAKQKWPMSTQ